MKKTKLTIVNKVGEEDIFDELKRIIRVNFGERPLIIDKYKRIIEVSFNYRGGTLKIVDSDMESIITGLPGDIPIIEFKEINNLVDLIQGNNSHYDEIDNYYLSMEDANF